MTPTPSDAQPPEWIRVDREDGDHGFWTCAAATETSPKYIRADLFDAERQKREAAERDVEAAEASLAEANATIERLAAEGLYISEQFSGAAGDIVKLRARIAELEAALRPFAAAAVEDDGTERVEWRYHDDDELVESTSALVEFTAGEFRRARAALTNIEKERDDG